MSNIENQIVSMKFDNASFERKLGDTIRSLDKLSKSLELTNATRGMDQLSAATKNVDVAKIADGVDKVASKFSVMGAVGFSAIQKITHGILGMVAQVANIAKTDILGPIISGGKSRAENIEQAKFQFRGLAFDVDKAMASVLPAVKGTAFGLDEAARAAAQLGASGIQVGDQMTSTLRGIAGAAAMTNTSFSEIAQIFTSSAGTGIVNNQDLMQFATRGLNAAAALAKVWGVTEKEVRQMATDGELSFAKFAEGMDKAFGKHATKANETFSGSLKNVRAAMSRLGASYFAPKMEQDRDVLNTLTPVIDNVAAALLPLIKTFLDIRKIGVDKVIGFLKNIDLSNFKDFIANISASFKRIFDTANHFADIVKSAFRDVFPKDSVSILKNIGQAFNMFTDKLLIAAPLGKTIRGIFQQLFSTIRDFGTIIKNVFNVIKHVLFIAKEAFKDIFPKTEVSVWFSIASLIAKVAAALKIFTDKLVIGSALGKQFRRMFQGLFAVIEIGWNILKETVLLIKDLIVHFNGTGKAGDFVLTVLDKVVRFLTKVADAAVNLNEKLLGGLELKMFFNRLYISIIKLPEAIGALKNKFTDFFATIQKFTKGIIDKIFPGKEGIPGGGAAGATLDSVASHMDRVKQNAGRLKKVWDGLVNVFQAVGTVLNKAWDAIKTWFSELGSKLADVMKPGDFNSFLDILNVGLLGGIILMLSKFVSGDFLKTFAGGFMFTVGRSLTELSNTLQAMQIAIKVGAIMGIAVAVALLAGSLLILSMINSADLTKALLAVSVGFGQLIAAMAILDTVGSTKGAPKIAIIAGSMILLAAATVILAGAIKIFATMSWEELAIGLAGITGTLGAITAAMQLMDVRALLAAGLAMIPLSTGLVLLAGAVKLFGTMTWDEIARGLAVLTGALGVLVAATQLLNPVAMLAAGAAMIPLATGILILAEAVQAFGNMTWDEVGRGLAVLTGALAILVAATHLINPVAMLAAGAAMIPLATGILILAEAVQAFGSMSWSEMGKGLLALAGTMLIIAIAVNAMPPWLPVIAAGLVLTAIALGMIAVVIASMGALKMGSLAKGLGALAAIMLILAVGLNAMTTALPGAAALVVAAGALMVLSKVIIALSGLSISQLAIALGAIAGVLLILGVAALVMAPVIPALLGLGAALTLLGLGFALFGAGAFLFGKALALIADKGVAAVKAVLEGMKILMTMSPEIFKHMVKVLVQFVDELLKSLPVLIKGVVVILGHILDSLTELAPKLWGLIRTLVIQMLTNIITLGPAIITTGLFILTKFLEGVRANISHITQLAIDILIKFTDTLAANAQRIVDAAVNLLTSFINALGTKENIDKLVGAGANLLIKFLEGVAGVIKDISTTVFNIITEFIAQIGKNLQLIIDAGALALVKFFEGLGKNSQEVINAAVTLVETLAAEVGKNTKRLTDAGFKMIIDFMNALATSIRENSDELRKAGLNLADAILDGITGGLSDKVGGLAGPVKAVGNAVVGGFKSIFKSKSPSKVMIGIAHNLMDGLAIGLKDNAIVSHDVVSIAENIVKTFEQTLSKIPESLGTMNEFNPTITPVLDLTKVQAGAKGMNKLMTSSTITPSVSLENARVISASTQREAGSTEPTTPVASTEVKFEQTINSPAPLATNDIYRNTRNLITLAKEELDIK